MVTRSIVSLTQQAPQVRCWTELHGLRVAVVVLECGWICHETVANLNQAMGKGNQIQAGQYFKLNLTRLICNLRDFNARRRSITDNGIFFLYKMFKHDKPDRKIKN